MTKSAKTTRETLVHDVHVRLSEHDMQLVRGVSEALGVPQSKAIRLMLRRVDGGAAAVTAAPVIEELRDALEKFARGHELHAVAVDRVGENVNQIARRLNSGEHVAPEELAAAIELVRGKIYDVRDYIARDPNHMFRWLGLQDHLAEVEAS